MKKLFIGGLVAAELAMLAGTMGGRFEPGALIAPPPPVDAKWARSMARKAERAARDDSVAASRRRALDACLGPDRESFTPTRYEAQVKVCEARMAGRAEAETEATPPFEYPKPPPQPEPSQAEATAQAPPAG